MKQRVVFKWYKVPKRGLCQDSSGTAIILRRGDVWYLSNSIIVSTHERLINPTHYMALPGCTNSWGIAPYEVKELIKKFV